MTFITTNAAVSYRLTPEQLVQMIAKDLCVAPETIAVDFSVEMRSIDTMDRYTQPTFTGCTIRKADR